MAINMNSFLIHLMKRSISNKKYVFRRNSETFIALFVIRGNKIILTYRLNVLQ